MRAYLINLRNRTDRLEQMKAAFATAGIAFERMIAVDGADEGVRSAAAACPRGRIGRPLEPAEFAVFQSHRNCWKALLASEDAYAIVCEDDVVIAGRPGAFLQAARMPPDADIVRLETFLTRVHLDRQGFGDDDSPYRLHRMRSEQLGAAAYAISRAAARRLLPLTETVDAPVDNFLFSPEMPGWGACVTYQMVPAPFVQAKRQSLPPGAAMPDWAASSLAESRDARHPTDRESKLQRLTRRLREELRALVIGTGYRVVPHG